MKAFLITTIAFLAFAITCNAQWTTSGTNIVPISANLGYNVGIGNASPSETLSLGSPTNGTNITFGLRGLSAGGNSIRSIFTQDATTGTFSLAIDPGLNGTTRAFALSVGVATNALYVNGNGNVGIGSTSPNEVLSLGSPTNGTNITLGLRGSSPTGNSIRSIFTQDAITGTFSLAIDPGLNGNARAFALSVGAAANALYVDGGGNLGIGTTNPDARLTVNGTIHSKSVVVDTNVPVPDYVFKNDYNLPSLAEIKTYTDKNHHLPGIPAAAELEKNGLNLGEMNMLLLKKVEELTLYLIEKDKQLQEQQKTNQAVKQQLDYLTEQLKALKPSAINNK